MKIDLYDDGIGSVELVQHMGEDLTVVNSAQSFLWEREKARWTSEIKNSFVI